MQMNKHIEANVAEYLLRLVKATDGVDGHPNLYVTEIKVGDDQNPGQYRIHTNVEMYDYGMERLNGD